MTYQLVSALQELIAGHFQNHIKQTKELFAHSATCLYVKAGGTHVFKKEWF
jgi:hypothetical protein